MFAPAMLISFRRSALLAEFTS